MPGILPRPPVLLRQSPRISLCVLRAALSRGCAMMSGNRGRRRHGINGQMGDHAPAARHAAARPAGHRGGPSRPRVHRRLVGRDERVGRVHAARPRRPVEQPAAPRHRHRRDLHPGTGPARDERGHPGRSRARPVRARHRRVIGGDRGAVERHPAGPALPALPRHAPVPARGPGRGEGDRGVRNVQCAGFPA